MITKRELERRGKLKVTSLVDKFQRDEIKRLKDALRAAQKIIRDALRPI